MLKSSSGCWWSTTDFDAQKPWKGCHPLSENAMKVLYSFPFRIGSGQICNTAWQQVKNLHALGVDLTAAVGSVARELPPGVSIRSSFRYGPFRFPTRWLGRQNVTRYHDRQVARFLASTASKFDLVHVWPLAGLETIKMARRLGIPVMTERPNSHTRYAFEAVQKECRSIGYALPEDHEHSFNQHTLDREEAEYAEADGLLCPSDFVARTFRERGFHDSKIFRHRYGYDDSRFRPGNQDSTRSKGLRAIYAGGCAPRKGVHHIIRSWIESGAAEHGELLLCGDFPSGFLTALGDMIHHPSIKVLGHRSDMPELMRTCDLFILPSVEEGSALTTYEARGSGCVLLVSDASGAVCEHGVNALIHRAGDGRQLTKHLALVNENRELLEKLRSESVSGIADLSWESAGTALLNCYTQILARKR
jgi:glycosyltransferase involved in cell wall biosynthesis